MAKSQKFLQVLQLPCGSSTYNIGNRLSGVQGGLGLLSLETSQPHLQAVPEEIWNEDNVGAVVVVEMPVAKLSPQVPSPSVSTRRWLSLQVAPARWSNGDKGTPHPQGRPSGSNKQEIYGVIAKIIFDGDPEYGVLFTSQPSKFAEVLKNSNRPAMALTITEGDPEYNNLLESILVAFPWYTDLHGLWKGIPSISPKAAINSTPGPLCGAQLLSTIKTTPTTMMPDNPSEPPATQKPLPHPDLND
ncbi:hypothetical protein BS17DRAFT_768997 [Gyrodon lividus]|nr:hypothetical protein BS17DRAFT_768997 [Gyrodon lividus]